MKAPPPASLWCAKPNLSWWLLPRKYLRHLATKSMAGALVCNWRRWCFSPPLLRCRQNFFIPHYQHLSPLLLDDPTASFACFSFFHPVRQGCELDTSCMLEREGKNEKCCVKHQILGTNQHGVETMKCKRQLFCKRNSKVIGKKEDEDASLTSFKHISLLWWSPSLQHFYASFDANIICWWRPGSNRETGSYICARETILQLEKCVQMKC